MADDKIDFAVGRIDRPGGSLRKSQWGCNDQNARQKCETLHQSISFQNRAMRRGAGAETVGSAEGNERTAKRCRIGEKITLITKMQEQGICCNKYFFMMPEAARRTAMALLLQANPAWRETIVPQEPTELQGMNSQGCICAI
jgi:hypothetical protein